MINKLTLFVLISCMASQIRAADRRPPFKAYVPPILCLVGTVAGVWRAGYLGTDFAHEIRQNDDGTAIVNVTRFAAMVGGVVGAAGVVLTHALWPTPPQSRKGKEAFAKAGATIADAARKRHRDDA